MDVLALARVMVSNSPQKILKKVLERADVQNLIIRLNTVNQFGVLHEDSTGTKLSSIGGPYALSTQSEKGVGPNDIDLRDTEDYWNSFIVIAETNGSFTIDSNPIKPTQNLEDRYGNKLEGLNSKNKAIVFRFLEEKYFEELANLL